MRKDWSFEESGQYSTLAPIQIMKKTANIWEYKVGFNAIVANFMWL